MASCGLPFFMVDCGFYALNHAVRLENMPFKLTAMANLQDSLT
jgi:hypothetical protein